MVLYICDRCGFSTSRKSYYENHLNRKKPCQKILGTKGVNTDPPEEKQIDTIKSDKSISGSDMPVQCEYC